RRDRSLPLLPQVRLGDESFPFHPPEVGEGRLALPGALKVPLLLGREPREQGSVLPGPHPIVRGPETRSIRLDPPADTEPHGRHGDHQRPQAEPGRAHRGALIAGWSGATRVNSNRDSHRDVGSRISPVSVPTVIGSIPTPPGLLPGRPPSSR